MHRRNAEALNYLTVAAKKVNELDIEADKIKAAPTAEKYADLSLLNYQAKRYPQCIATAQEAIKLKPGFAEAYNNMGAAYVKLQQYDKAVDALKEAIKLKPDLAVAQNNLIDAAKGVLADGIRTTNLMPMISLILAFITLIMACLPTALKPASLPSV